MAAKLLHSLADDNPDLQNQTGRMTGDFQLFDRHQMVAGRRFPGESLKRRPPGIPQLDNGTTDSSIDSFSSMSPSSSFSSLDCNVNRTSHPDPDHNMFPKTLSRDSATRQSCGSDQTNRQSFDLRDAVKGSMYKLIANDEAPDHVVNAFAKFQEANWYGNEPREHPRSRSYQFRDQLSFSVQKDCPRFSYDVKETNCSSFQLQDNARTVSRVLNKSSDSKVTQNFKSDRVISPNRGLNQSRPPSVVAKLMGLETLPDYSSTNRKDLGMDEIKTPFEDVNSLLKSSKRADTFGPIKMQSSPRTSPREPTSPLWKNSDMRPISRFPVEPAPWKLRNGAQSPQRPVSGAMKSPSKIHSQYSSVYSEVEKRLKHLEFTQSGKDLRALKQISEAMQSLEARKEGAQVMVKRNDVSTQREQFSDHGRSQGDHENPSLANRRMNHLRAYESPNVGMKPAKHVERSRMQVEELPIDDRNFFANRTPKSTRKENAVYITDVKATGRSTRTSQASTKKQQLTKENTTISAKSSRSISPQLQQRRPELDPRSRPPTPRTDSSKPRKQLTRQVLDSSSPGGRRQPKHSNIQQGGGDQSHADGSESKFSYRETQVSHEKSNLLLREDESLDPEYPSPVSVLDDSTSPIKHMPKTVKDDATHGVKDEWEEPVDVIPDTLYSGVTFKINRKKLQNIEHLVQKLTRLNSSHDEAHTDYIASLCENTKPDDRYISEILLASGLLLRDLGSSLTTFPFHSSGHPINPELFLVLEQTKFSNPPKQEPPTLLKKEKYHRKLIFDTVNEILAGKLALVVPSLEPWSRKSFKLARKTLNAQKLLRDLCLEIEQLQVRKKREDDSLDEEDEGLRNILWEEEVDFAESWVDYDGELAGIGLEVERLIFKDLVSEVVLGEAADGRLITPGKRCRSLGSK